MMDVIEKMRELLTECQLLNTFNGSHIDYTKPDDNSYGLYSNGSAKTGEDLLGNETYTHNFVVYATVESYEDFNRLVNSSWLLELTYFLNTITDVPITAKINETVKEGIITKITAGNAMSYTLPTGNINDGIQYQLQINVTYKIMED